MMKELPKLTLRDLVKYDPITKIGNLTEIFRLSPLVRIEENKKGVTCSNFLKSNQVQILIQLISKQEGLPVDKILYTEGRGQNRKTCAHLHILVLAAQTLCGSLQLEVIKEASKNL